MSEGRYMGTTLKTVVSSSNPGKFYAIMEGADGVIYCTCTGWKMRKTCKHLDAYHRNTDPKTITPTLQDIVDQEVEKLRRV